MQSGKEVAMEGVSLVGEVVGGTSVDCHISDFVGGRVDVTKGSNVGVAACSEILMQDINTIQGSMSNATFLFIRINCTL